MIATHEYLEADNIAVHSQGSPISRGKGSRPNVSSHPAKGARSTL
jgi:hypothetical protein